MSKVVDTQLPSYFPLKLKKCTIPADAFFACFDHESLPNGVCHHLAFWNEAYFVTKKKYKSLLVCSIPCGFKDKDVARKALATCSDLLQDYKKCMNKYVGPTAKPSSQKSWWWPF